MRIGIVMPPLEKRQPGATPYLVELFRALLRHDSEHEFHLLAGEADAPAVGAADVAARLVRLPRDQRTRWRAIAWQQRVLPRIAQDLRLDVLHVVGARELLWRHPCGLVATIEDLAPLLPAPGHAAHSFWSTRSLLVRLLCRQDELVAPTPGTAARLAAVARIPVTQVTVAPAGVDHDRFTDAGREHSISYLNRRYAITPPFLVAAAGHPAADGGMTPLIAAFTGFKTLAPSPWRLVILGAGPEQRTLLEAVRRSPYAPDIHCAGDIPQDDLPHWYRAAGFLVYPVAGDGFMLPVLEAMACGCAVLAPATPEARDLCGPAALYADPGDRTDLQLRLMRLGWDEELRHRCSAAGLRRAARHDWRATADAMLEVYERAGRGARSRLLVPALAPLERTP